MAIMVITTSNSINVKASSVLRLVLNSPLLLIMAITPARCKSCVVAPGRNNDEYVSTLWFRIQWGGLGERLRRERVGRRRTSFQPVGHPSRPGNRRQAGSESQG